VNGDRIVLSFPARPDYILAVRLTVSAVAERIGFDIEEIEDLKVASAEACTLLLAEGANALELCMTVDGGINMDFSPIGETAGAAEKEPDGLSKYLLDALVDTCEMDIEDNKLTAVHLRKSLSNQ